MRKRCTLIAISLVAALLVAAACSGGSRRRFRTSADRRNYIHRHNLEKLPPSDVPLEINERVLAWMDYFSGSGSRHFKRYLTRSGKYIPMMQQILKQYGLPKDLVYVALIESGFNNNARSHANAVGPWQFIRATGRRYNLRVDSWVDERRDPVKATHAAARYLRDLHNEFGHWYLAMAGYNAGEGRVRKAIRASGSRNFWDHANPDKKYLRAETRDYVPKYIAANIMAKRPEQFGFTNVKYEKPDEYDVVTVATQTDFAVIAKCAQTSTHNLEVLNPHLRLSATPPGARNYTVKVPKGKKERFRVAYAKVPKKERIKLVTYRVRKGDTMHKVARKFGVSTRELARANGIGRKSRLRRGASLVIPKGAAYRTRVAKAESYGGKRKTVYHRVRRGDTLGKIARRYSVKTSQLRSWNKLNRRGTIRVGQKLKIRKKVRGRTRVAKREKSRGSGGAVTVKHRVRSGETLWTIARKYDVSVSDVRRWNGIKGNRIKPGQKLKIRGGSSSPVEDGPAPERIASSGGTHTLESGQTLGHVAEIYGVSTKDIMRWNGIKNPRRVRVGKKLVIKGGGTKKRATATTAKRVDDLTPEPKKRQASSGGSHTLESGQTLGHVAEIYGVSTKDIMRWNGIKNPRRVRVGKKLVIKGGKKKTAAKTTKKSKPIALVPKEDIAAPIAEPEPLTGPTKPAATTKKKAKTYKIKSGDSLWSVAQKHGVSVKEIKKWNGMGKSNKIKPGQKIVIKKK